MRSVLLEGNSGSIPETSSQVAIVCESTCCIPQKLVVENNLYVIPVPFELGNEPFLDGVNITADEFYNKLSLVSSPPKTSPPSPGEYLATWQRAREEYQSILTVTIGSKLSTFDRSIHVAREMARELMSGVQIKVVDSLSAGMGQGFVALAAARTAREGKSTEEVVKVAEKTSHKVQMVVTLNTLEYLAKSSRIPQVAAIIGGILAIKPIIVISDGDIHPLMRVRTRQRSLQQLYEYLQTHIPADKPLHIAIQHAQALDEALDLQERVKKSFHCVEVMVTEFTPIMGGYCGPGLVGAAFYTED